MNKPVYLTESQIDAGISYCEAQLNHPKTKADPERLAHFQAEVQMLREMLEERLQGIVKLL